MIEGVNLLAVAVAALTSFLLGGIWYSTAVFGRVWNREAGMGGNFKQGHPAIVFGLAYVLSFIAAGLLAKYLGPNPEFATAVSAGLSVGLGFVACSFGINYLFGGRSLKLWLIDAGYHTLQFTLFGVVFGLWP